MPTTWTLSLPSGAETSIKGCDQETFFLGRSLVKQRWATQADLTNLSGWFSVEMIREWLHKLSKLRRHENKVQRELRKSLHKFKNTKGPRFIKIERVFNQLFQITGRMPQIGYLDHNLQSLIEYTLVGGLERKKFNHVIEDAMFYTPLFREAFREEMFLRDVLAFARGSTSVYLKSSIFPDI